jgi:hypothetical protein
LFFAVFAGALAGAVLLGWAEILAPQFRVSELPVACAFRRNLGFACPGCGLTRSWVALGRGDVAASIAFHRLGWLVMLWAGLQVVRHGVWLWIRPLRGPVDRAGWWLDRALVAIAVAMFVSWGLQLAGI